MTTRPLIPVDISEALFFAEILLASMKKRCGPKTDDQVKLEQMVKNYKTRINGVG